MPPVYHAIFVQGENRRFLPAKKRQKLRVDSLSKGAGYPPLSVRRGRLHAATREIVRAPQPLTPLLLHPKALACLPRQRR